MTAPGRLGIEARAIAEHLGVGTAPQPSVERVAQRLMRIEAEAKQRGAAEPVVLRAARMTVEPVLVSPVPGLDAVLLVEGGREVIIVGSPDELHEVTAGIDALVDDGATS